MSTSPEVLQKARRWCAAQERCQQEVRDKLYTWGLHREAVEQAIAGDARHAVGERRHGPGLGQARRDGDPFGDPRIESLRHALEELDRRRPIRLLLGEIGLEHEPEEPRTDARAADGGGTRGGRLFGTAGSGVGTGRRRGAHR